MTAQPPNRFVFDVVVVAFAVYGNQALLTGRQHGSYNNHVNRRFSNTLECTVIVVQRKRKWKMASWAQVIFIITILSVMIVFSIPIAATS